MKKYHFVKVNSEGRHFLFWKCFPSEYLADRWASKTILNRKISFCVVFLAGDELKEV